MFSAERRILPRLGFERLKRPLRPSHEQLGDPIAGAIEFIAQQWEQDGVDIGIRLRFIRALESERMPKEKQGPYQEAAANLRRRWGLANQPLS